MSKPFDKVPQPSKTIDRIVERGDGGGYQLLSEKEKQKIDTAKKMKDLGLLEFSDDEGELSLSTVASHKLKGSNKSHDSHKSVTKPETYVTICGKSPSGGGTLST